LLQALTTEHRLQAFDRAYFDGSCDVNGNPLWSYAHEWRRGMEGAPLELRLHENNALSAWMPLETLSLGQLRQFVRCPVQYFCQQRLQVSMRLPDVAVQDDEPFEIDGLRNWQLQDELIAVQRKAVHRGADRETALHAQLQRMARRGDLPQGHFAQRAQESLASPMGELFDEYTQALVAWPHAEKALQLDIACQLEDGSMLSVQDSLGDVRSNGSNMYARVVISSTGLVESSGAKAYRREKIMPVWVEHLAAHMAGYELCTYAFSKAGKVVLPVLQKHEAKQYWQALLQSYQRGLQGPLPLALRTGFAWLKEGGDSGSLRHSKTWKAVSEIYDAEAENNLYLSRAWPDFEYLSAGGDFANAVQALLRPLWNATPPLSRNEEVAAGTKKAAEKRKYGGENTPFISGATSSKGSAVEEAGDAEGSARKPRRNSKVSGDEA
jgi:exodeoxyribonuclease V gamma subunit